MPKTAPEIEGLIKREDLGMIKGRSRKPQLQMAKEFGIQDPPNAGGGCLLTDPAFGKRAIDLFDHTKDPTINDIDLLKIGYRPVNKTLSCGLCLDSEFQIFFFCGTFGIHLDL